MRAVGGGYGVLVIVQSSVAAISGGGTGQAEDLAIRGVNGGGENVESSVGGSSSDPVDPMGEQRQRQRATLGGIGILETRETVETSSDPREKVSRGASDKEDARGRDVQRGIWTSMNAELVLRPARLPGAGRQIHHEHHGALAVLCRLVVLEQP